MAKKSSFKKPVKLRGDEREGLVVALFGPQAEVEDEFGGIIHCHVRKNIETIVTGDRVLWLQDKGDTGIIVAHLPRKSLLFRPENIYKNKYIAANIDVIFVTTAPPPIFSPEMIDRYLVAAENLKIQPIILLNKMDLLSAENKKLIEPAIATYEKIGYKFIFSSTVTRDGLDELKDFLVEKSGVLIGPSGVGKSSIIAALTASQSIRINEVSAGTGLGKHTTTNTRLYHLPAGGNVIDSPGVREFGLWNVEKNQLIDGFVEFKKFANRCKFRDCHHHKEPGCAIRQAVADKEIDERRFENFLKIAKML